MTHDFYVRNKDDLIEAVQTYGIVPYFSNSIPGFSLEEHCGPRALWSDTGDDSWSWKGSVIGLPYNIPFKVRPKWSLHEP